MGSQMMKLQKTGGDVMQLPASLWNEIVDEHELLIRAVRQLGAFVDYGEIYTNDGKVRKNSPIDLDVLELIE